MRLRKYIPVLIYFLLLLGCLGIVVLTGRLAGREENVGEEDIWETGEAKETGEMPAEDAEEPDSSGEKPQKPSLGEDEETGKQYISGDRKRHKRDEVEKTEEETEAWEEPYEPLVLMMASDLHHISGESHDEGEAFWKMVQEDDGKVSMYSDVLIDVLAEEAIATRPSALVLTGDITLNGERKNHLSLAGKLRRVKEAGIPVLVIPGNHDIKNRNGAVYFGKEREETEYLETGQDFFNIYHEFGYDQAFRRDSESLSYFYELDESHWMLMLDTCQYEDYNHVNGRLKPETMEWMEEYLIQAEEQGIQVLPVGHHNLLSESRLYTVECTMENHMDIIRLFEKYELPLYVSGHLHAQRIKKHKAEPGVAEESYGISEIVLSPYSIPPCQYGLLSWPEDGRMEFVTRQADVEGYAEKIGSTDERLWHFGQYGREFVKEVIEEQVKKTIHGMPKDLKSEMADLYGDLYFDYCAGNSMDQKDKYSTRAYALWERADPDNGYRKDMKQILEDTKQEMHSWREPEYENREGQYGQ